MAVGLQSFLSGAVVVLSTFVGADLGMTTVEITWINAASGLSSGAFLLFFGRLTDLFGRKSILIISLGLFSVFCLAAGFSNSGITLDVWNGLIGLTSASGVPAALGILGNAYDRPGPRKNAAFAVFSAGNPLGFVFGCIISGIATQLASWRATFWVLAGLYAFVTGVSFFCVPPDTSEKAPLTMATLKKFDVVGVLLTVGGVGFLSAALGLGTDAPQGWRTPYIIVFLVLGVLLCIAFVFWELRFKYPLMPMSIWRDRNFSLLIAILSLGFFGFPVGMFWISLYMQTVLRYTPISVALHLLPCAISGIAINIIAGAFLHRVSNKLLMGVGAVAYTISFALYAANRFGDSYWALIFPGAVITVFGADFQFNVCNMYVMSSMPADQQGIAGAILQMITKLCSTLTFGIATAIFSAVLAHPATSGYYANNPAEPYAATFWYSTILAALSVLLVPFLTIGTQGAKEPRVVERQEEVEAAAGLGVGPMAEGQASEMQDLKLKDR